ncbi:gibberellin 2-beta-dioxygenase 2-like [Prosopis cineraria]|uniref:gibberellin 2-beta-dioxygenase 2-like n=1 Tax=Prosopis cineraria TaxID=364024 RepID=UPI002410148D|nr:gibberellin 2-beta-dioxygenase 2-like [Prosopis cineraria]
MGVVSSFYGQMMYPLEISEIKRDYDAGLSSFHRSPLGGEMVVGLELPRVDLSEERWVVAKQIVKASEEYGFFKVVKHGVPEHTIAAMEEEAAAFFAKPVAQKKAVAGYGSNTIGFCGDVGCLDYLLLNASPSSSSISQLNPSKFRSTVSEYVGAVRELACEILELMAEGLGVPDTLAFSSFLRHHDSDSLLRFNHYPPLLLKDINVAFGEHSDPQILTLLRSNDVAGLQISLPDGLWFPVSPDPSAFFVNVGDALQVMTNGRFVSVRHRAMTNSDKSRMSMAFFGAPPLNACIAALPEMVTTQRPSLYRPFTWAEYKQAAYSLRLGDHRIHLFRMCTQVDQ